MPCRCVSRQLLECGGTGPGRRRLPDPVQLAVAAAEMEQFLQVRSRVGQADPLDRADDDGVGAGLDLLVDPAVQERERSRQGGTVPGPAVPEPGAREPPGLEDLVPAGPAAVVRDLAGVRPEDVHAETLAR